MKITESTVALQSQHASLSLHSTQMRLRSWVGSQRPDFEGRAQQQPTPGVRFTLSEAARSQLARLSQAQATRVASRSEVGALADDVNPIEPRLRVLMEMVQAITGREVKVFNARDLQPQPGAGGVAAPAPAQAAASASATPQPAGWGLELDATQRVVEAEAMQVSIQGEVRTADGQNIAFTLQLAMSRSFVQESSVSVRAGDAVRQDPLVINFNGSGAELSDAQFAFDLDADGQTENMAFVRGGSGFLVFDKNADGQVNNGSELFGPASGDGFADLAQYDLDGNQWIDDNDAVYNQLQVWQRDADGQDRLSTLAQNGVGALFLGRVASPFSVNTAANQTLGLVRSTGVFLYESGAAGTLQQVDL